MANRDFFIKTAVEGGRGVLRVKGIKTGENKWTRQKRKQNQSQANYSPLDTTTLCVVI
jgi:hypothetical protein